MTPLYADPIVNETSFSALFTVLQSSTDNYFGFGILITIYIMLFIAFSSAFRFKAAFGASTFIVNILAMMLLAAGIITQGMLWILVVLLIVSMVLLLLDS